MATPKMKISNYILAIIRSNRAVMYSWGFSKPTTLRNYQGVRFMVNGFKHSGFVQVMYHRGKDLFYVLLLDGKRQEISRIEDVEFELLVETIDRAVARTTDYLERIRMN